MATVIDLTSLTINPEEARTVSEIIAPLIYSDEAEFQKKHRLVSGIVGKTQIVLDGGNANSGWVDTGCTPPASGGMDITLTQLYWDLVTIGDEVTHCQKEVDQNFKMLVKKFASDHSDISSSNAVLNYIIARLLTFITEARERNAYLGDTDATQDTASGYIKTGVDTKFYTAVDGYWKQLFAYVAAGTTPRYTISANATATKALQLTLASTAGYDALKGMWDNADDKLKSAPTSYFELTPALYWNYSSYLATTPATIGGFTNVIVDGVQKMAYMGKPVYESQFIGGKILSDFQIITGTSPAVYTYNLPNRGIFTTPENTPVATLSDEDVKNIESFYYQKDRTNIMRYAFDVDVKVLRPALASVAY
jgi:hypothetical protein